MTPVTKFPLRIAHRGMPGLARENTLDGFALAISAGADGIELDVHATKDGIIIVHHDPVLQDGTKLARLARRELAAIPGAADIPELADVCALVAGQGTLFVEIKGAGIEEAVVRTLSAYEGDVAIHSFDHALIGRLHRMGVAYRLRIAIEDRVPDLPRLLRDSGALDVWPDHRLADAEMLGAVHQLGGRVIPWTVNDAADVERMVRFGVDGICTDDVSALPRLPGA